jgi:hypothetical protein
MSFCILDRMPTAAHLWCVVPGLNDANTPDTSQNEQELSEMNCRPEVTGRSPLQRFTTSPAITDDCVLTFDEWCELNGFSRSTGQRIVASGTGPTFVRLSARRKGVTIGENRRWLASRLIETAA